MKSIILSSSGEPETAGLPSRINLIFSMEEDARKMTGCIIFSLLRRNI